MALGQLTEPRDSEGRQITMKNLGIALALAAVLTACGSESDDGGVTGQDPTTGPPTAAPTGPPWPEFAAADYTFVYSRTCYCPDAGIRIKVSVVDDEAVDAVYAETARGIQKGDPATADYQLITLDDVIDHANTEGAADVTVEWPAGQDYPDRVWVDQDEMMADEEIGYEIHRVTVA
jgi:hypothetical protein